MNTPHPDLGAAIRQWAATFHDPCVTDRTRAGIRQDLTNAVARDPNMAAAVLAAIVFDVADLLPGVDPWRAAVAGQFGGVDDHTDLVPSMGDPDDWLLVAVEDDLAPDAAQIVLASFERAHLELLLGSLFAADVPDALTAVDDALRYLEYRRRAYTDAYDDPWIVMSAEHWTTRGVQPVYGAPSELDGQHILARLQRRIANDRYDPAQRAADLFRPFTEEEIPDALR